MRNLIRRFFSAIADGIGSGISTMATTGKKKYLNLEGLTYLCSKIKDALTLKLDKSQIVQNATTAATDKVPSAAVVKNLQDQITQLNTKTQPVSKGNAEFSGNWSGVVSHVQVGEVHFVYGMISHNSDTSPDWGEKVCKLPNYDNAYWMPVSAFRTSGYILDAFAITTDGEIHVYSPDYGQIKKETYHIMAVAQSF